MVPVPLIRRNYILRKLRRCGADCPERAVTFREAGVFNPDGFPMVTRRMISQSLICTVDGPAALPPGRRIFLPEGPSRPSKSCFPRLY